MKTLREILPEKLDIPKSYNRYLPYEVESQNDGVIVVKTPRGSTVAFEFDGKSLKKSGGTAISKSPSTQIFDVLEKLDTMEASIKDLEQRMTQLENLGQKFAPGAISNTSGTTKTLEQRLKEFEQKLEEVAQTAQNSTMSKVIDQGKNLASQGKNLASQGKNLASQGAQNLGKRLNPFFKKHASHLLIGLLALIFLVGGIWIGAKIFSQKDQTPNKTDVSKKSLSSSRTGRLIQFNTTGTSRRSYRDSSIKGDPSIKISDLILDLKNPLEEKRIEVAKLLGESGKITAGSYLIKMLNDSSPGVRQMAIRSLGDLQYRHATNNLIEIVEKRKGDKAIIDETILALGKIGDMRGADCLIEILKNRNEKLGIWLSAAESLGRLGDARASSILIEALSWGNIEMREAAANALAQFSDPRAASKLIRLLEKKQTSVEVKIAAANALGNLAEKASRCVRVLLKVHRNKNNDLDLRDMAKDSMQRLYSKVSPGLQEEIKKAISEK